MYHQERSILLRSSASSLNNNLSLVADYSNVQKVLRIAVVHRSTVNLVNLSEKGQHAREVECKDNTRVGLISQAKWCEIESDYVLVVASQYGIQVYNEGGTMLLYWNSFSSSDVRNETDTFARGICTLGENLLIVGSYDGSLLTFSFSLEAKRMTPGKSLLNHSAPIGDVASWNRTLVSGDDVGVVSVWHHNNDDTITVVHTSENFGSPCTSLSVWQEQVLAGYTTGHLRIFSVITGLLTIEICAHARAITSIDVAPQAGLGLSASEDGYVHVWKLKTGSELNGTAFSEHIPDSQLCGARFLNPKGNGFCVTSYDSEEIICFTI